MLELMDYATEQLQKRRDPTVLKTYYYAFTLDGRSIQQPRDIDPSVKVLAVSDKK